MLNFCSMMCSLSVLQCNESSIVSAQRLQYAFLEAASKGDLDRMKDLIGQGCSVNARSQVKFPCALIQSLLNIRYIILQACRIGYLRVATRKYVGAHTAIRRSSADLCNVENVHEWMCNHSYSIDAGYRLLKKYSWSQAGAKTFLSQVSHFVTRSRLKVMCCKSIYVSRWWQLSMPIHTINYTIETIN